MGQSNRSNRFQSRGYRLKVNALVALALLFSMFAPLLSQQGEAGDGAATRPQLTAEPVRLRTATSEGIADHFPIEIDSLLPGFERESIAAPAVDSERPSESPAATTEEPIVSSEGPTREGDDTYLATEESRSLFAGLREKLTDRTTLNLLILAVVFAVFILYRLRAPSRKRS